MQWAVTESLASLKRKQNYTPDNKNHNLGASSSTYESASAIASAPSPNPTNTLDNMPKPRAHTSNDSPTPFTTPHRTYWWDEEDNENHWQEAVIGPTSLTTPPKVSWAQEDYCAYQLQKDIRGVATQNTTYRAYEGNTTRKDDNNPLPPSPPNEPPPTFVRTPPPPPDEQQHEYAPLPDDKGITSHEDRRRYKVTLTCTYCRTQYTTKWGEGDEPYRELRNAKWQQGRDGSSNYTWQRARCPDYYHGCGGGQIEQGQLAIQY